MGSRNREKARITSGALTGRSSGDTVHSARPEGSQSLRHTRSLRAPQARAVYFSKRPFFLGFLGSAVAHSTYVAQGCRTAEGAPQRFAAWLRPQPDTAAKGAAGSRERSEQRPASTAGRLRGVGAQAAPTKRTARAPASAERAAALALRFARNVSPNRQGQAREGVRLSGHSPPPSPRASARARAGALRARSRASPYSKSRSKSRCGAGVCRFRSNPDYPILGYDYPLARAQRK